MRIKINRLYQSSFIKPSSITIMNATWRTIKYKKCLTALLGSIILISMMGQQLQTTNSYRRQLNSSPTSPSSRTRPVIHTFFHPLFPFEEKVLELWKDEWYRAGFDPVVLTLDDAKKNPYFNEVEEIVTPLHGETGYNALCFYRWLAMATVEGGGWMSDHDTFPTNILPLDAAFLPRMGAFTSFEGHIPSLMAGSKEEWDRVSHLLIAMIPNIPDGMGISDMHALMMLKEQGRDKNGIWFDPPHHSMVIQGFRYHSPGIVHCEAMKIGKVNHMSHKVVHLAVDKGLFPYKSSEEDPYGNLFRAEAVKIFLDQWREQCSVVDKEKTVKKSSLLSDYSILKAKVYHKK